MQIVTKDAEVRLVDQVTSLREEGGVWKAIEFRFSRLLEHYRSDYQIKIATNLIQDLLKALTGNIYIYPDSTIILVCKGISEVFVEKVIFQLRYLFMDDPLSYHSDGSENEEFCVILDSTKDYPELLKLAKLRVAMLSKVVRYKLSDNPAELNATNLSHVERSLIRADIGQVLRRQPVCAIVGNNSKRVFNELYVNIQHLRSLMQIEVDLLSSRWLFKYLTQILDQRMLGYLRDNIPRYFDGPASLNLNVQTLLSKQFTEFDAALKPSVKVSMVVEIQLTDALENMQAFLLAKDMLQKRGYRVCLDGHTNLTFTQVDRERLGFDLAKLQWNAELPDDIASAENQKLLAAIRQCGPTRVILCRCDSKRAVEYGQALGISLFQGRYIDKLLNPISSIEN